MVSQNALALGRDLSESEIDAHVSEVHARGYTIVPAAIDATLLEELIVAKNALTADGSVFLSNLMSKDPAFWGLAAAPNVLKIVQRIIGEDCLISSTTLTCPPPGMVYNSFVCLTFTYIMIT